MKRKLAAMFLAVVMLVGVIAIPIAAQSVPDEDPRIRRSVSGFYYVLADGDQIAISAYNRETIIEVDGLLFRDLNNSGELDPYEDWRLPTAERVADLMSQMTTEELVGQIIHSALAGRNGIHIANVLNDDVLFGTTPTVMTPGPSDRLYQPIWYTVNEFHITSFLSNISGHLQDQMELINAVQGIGENTRLGVPIILASDRTYSTWGGMIEMGRYAFSAYGCPELIFEMVHNYSLEMNATGNNTILHTFGHEIGFVYGNDIPFLSEMAYWETRAAVDAGIISHTKHFIGRGGRANFNAARSVADLWENWMPGWEAVLNAGTQWIMTNNAPGFTRGIASYMCPETYGFLRNKLGFDGVVTMDWPWTVHNQGRTQNTAMLANGRFAADMTDAEIYAWILYVGVDQFSAIGLRWADYDGPMPTANVLVIDPIYDGIEDGTIDMELVKRSAARPLTAKFDIGLFDNPFRCWENAKYVISGSRDTPDEMFRVCSIEDIQAVRRPEMNELEERLMAGSAILLKNDGILPLAPGTRIYYDSMNMDILARMIPALREHGEIVDNPTDADVIILQLVYTNDAGRDTASALIEKAMEAGVPLVTIFEVTFTHNSEPHLWMVEASSAVLMQTYRTTPGYGQMHLFAPDAFYFPFTQASVTADMLFGNRNPGGTTVFEMGFDHLQRLTAFGDLAHNIGANDFIRLHMAQLSSQDPRAPLPNNMGTDIIVTTGFGMRFGYEADIELKWLLVPRQVVQVETVNAAGNIVIQNQVHNLVQAGVPFEINFVAENHGYAGHVNAEVLLDGEVIATRFIALADHQFRVITMEITIDTPGEFVLSVGEYSAAIVVE